MAPWNVVAAGSVTVSRDGGDLVVTADGVQTRRAAASVSILSISAGGTVSVPADLGTPVIVGAAAALAVSGTGVTWTTDGAGSGSVAGVTFSHVGRLVAAGAGQRLAGPATDTTWQITGAGSGTAAGQSFTGFAALVGASGNRDDFVVAQGGSIGAVDGGAGGYDTLRFTGTHSTIVSTPTGAQSGGIVADGHSIAYAGLEPVAAGTVSDFTFTDPTDADTIEVSPDAGNPGFILIRSITNAFESHSVLPTASFHLTSTGKNGLISIIGVLTFLGVTFVFQSTQIAMSSGAALDAGTGDITLNGDRNVDGLDARGSRGASHRRSADRA